MQKQKGKSEKRESRGIKNTKSAKSAKSVKSAKNTKSANSARGVQSSDYNVDNIIAPATVPGSGAVGIIRVSGGDSIKIAAKVIKLKSGAKSASTGAKKGSTTLLSAEPRRLYLANIEENDKLIDELLVAVFKALDSYTGEDCVEIFTHASAYIMNKVQMMMMREASQLLESKKISAPLRMAFAGEFTQRAFLNGKMDLAQAEAVADLIASETESAHTMAMNQMRGAFPGDLEPLFDLNGDGVFDLHDVQDYTEYQFGYKVPEAEYAAIVGSDAVDITKYREYPDSDDSISEAVFKNCVKLEKANIEFEKTYGFAYQEKENPESIVRIGFQNMIELYFMNNEYKLIYAKPEYYTENRPGCEGLPLYDRVDLYRFVSQYAGSHGFTTTKLSFNETTFNLFYDKWSAAVKNGTADLPDVNGNGIIDKDDFSFLQQYEKEIWAKTPETDTKLPRSIRSFLDTEFDLNENGISGDLYDVMGASLFIRANYPELTPDVSTSAVPEATISFPKGDANCDGKVSVADSVAILQFIANRDKFNLKPQGKENADVNGDGSVTGSDALEIQKMDAGVIVIK